MQVKLKTIMAGPEARGQPGQIVNVDPKVGEGLIAGGYAEGVSEAPPPTPAPVENAATSAPETADVKPQVPGKRGGRK